MISTRLVKDTDFIWILLYVDKINSVRIQLECRFGSRENIEIIAYFKL